VALAKWLVAGWLIQLAAIVGYCEIAQSSIASPGKYAVAALAVIALGFVLYRILRIFGHQPALISVAALVVGSVLMYQVLAFTLYPGLAKDVDVFSVDQLSQIVWLFLTSAVGHVSLFLAVAGVSKAIATQTHA
jgi:hypothetical protein